MKISITSHFAKLNLIGRCSGGADCRFTSLQWFARAALYPGKIVFQLVEYLLKLDFLYYLTTSLPADVLAKQHMLQNGKLLKTEAATEATVSSILVKCAISWIVRTSTY